ncbi:MAG: hypothetical protein V4484_11270 [Pseudomonadota bacterium]
MKRMRLEKINFAAVRERGNETEQHRLAERTFQVLRPLYGHLTDAEYTTVLDYVIRDATPVVFRAIFMIDDRERDVGLIGVRIVETTHDGQTVAYLTTSLGLHPEARGEKHSTKLVWREMLRYRLQHPLRPFFIIDTPISAASYRKLHKGVAKIFPTPGQPIPDRLWPLCDAIATEKGWLPIAGCPKEARSINRPRTSLSINDARPASPAYRAIQRWFDETTNGVVGSSVLIIIPITVSNMAMSILKQAKDYFYQK